MTLKIIVASFKSLINMNSISKYELHLHLGGSYPLEFLSSIATNGDDVDKLKDNLRRFETGVSYQDCFSVFDCVSKLVNTEEKVENGVYALCKDLSQDGVVYVEIRTGLKDLGSGYESYLTSILNGIMKFQNDYTNDQIKFEAVILLSLRRNTTKFMAELTSDLLFKYRNRNVIGLDISGDSLNGDAFCIFEIANKLHHHNIPITLHIGESNLETEEQQMKELQDIKPNRIGHAVHLHEEARNYVIKNRIPIEMCLSSATKVQMVNNMKDHPALSLINAKLLENSYDDKNQAYPILICTDDPLIFNTSLSKECQLTADILNLSEKHIIRMQESAFKHSFLHYASNNKI